MKKNVMVYIIGMLLLSACGTKAGIEVSDAWSRSAAQGTTGVIYFVIQNHNADADTLIGASSDVAGVVEVHETKMENGVMSMNHVESVALEPSAKVEFKPGGFHVMLINLKQDLKAGDEVTFTLHFKNSPDLTINATVKDAGSTDMSNMNN